MATALFITRKQLVQNSILDGNVDTDKFIQFVKIAQEIHIRNYLGTDLYNKISTDIAGTGGASLTGNYLTFAAYQIKNGGVFKHISENAESVSKNEVDFLVEKERDIAEYYTRRFIDYMSFNQSLFPEYTSNSNEDIDPDKDALFNGWVL